MLAEVARLAGADASLGKRCATEELHAVMAALFDLTGIAALFGKQQLGTNGRAEIALFLTRLIRGTKAKIVRNQTFRTEVSFISYFRGLLFGHLEISNMVSGSRYSIGLGCT